MWNPDMQLRSFLFVTCLFATFLIELTKASYNGFFSPYDAYSRLKYEGNAVILPDVIDYVEEIAIFPVWVLHRLRGWKCEVSSGHSHHMFMNPSIISEMTVK